MSRDDDQVAIRETVGAYRKRGGVARLNDTGRVTLGSFVNCKDSQRGRGYLTHIRLVSTGQVKRTTKTTSVKATIELLKSCADNDVIYELYPTRFCTNERCGKASWSFAHFPHKGHSTCTYCGYEQRLIQHNMDSRHLGEDEKVNKTLWNCTPGMTVHDCTLHKKGKRIQIGHQRVRSHMRHFWKCQSIIDDIADSFYQQIGSSTETLSKQAKYKCKRFYYSIHDGSDTYLQRKMPHGKAQFAAACFYAAVLEFSQRRNITSPCSLVAIQEIASQYVDFRDGRRTRDVTVAVIIRYTKMLRRWNLCDANIPEITADTLRFKSENVEKEHTRLAIFNKCHPTMIHLPTNKPWGIKLGDTYRGVLYVESVAGDSEAFKAGVQKGDYLFQVEDTVIGVEYSPDSVAKLIGNIKQNMTSNPYIKVNIMREKK